MPDRTSSDQDIRNIAIIAHVDHGKTTLVDSMFRQSGVFRSGKEMDDRIMDQMDLERERGITIAAKNCSIRFRDTKINILDTPGHADFGAEVERALSMVDGAILLVDAAEGPLPQTRFVLSKALEAGMPVIVVINKIDRHDARPQEVLNEVFDLFIDLDASEEQLEFPCLYAIGRDGVASKDLDTPGTSLEPLFESILTHMNPPDVDPALSFRMLVSDLGFSDYLGRLAIGKVLGGTCREKERMVRVDEDGNHKDARITALQVYDGMSLAREEQAQAGDIIVLSGMEDVEIGDTIALASDPVQLPRIRVDAPTVSMRFTINTSPLAGREGKLVQSRKIRERLIKETRQNVAIQVEDTGDRDTFIVKGRGELQMAILIETMRREGFEICVGRPEVIMKNTDEGLMEPIEELLVDCNEEFMGVVAEKMSIRKGRLESVVNNGTGRVRLIFSVPSRALIGYRDEFLTDTKGTGIMNAILSGYEAYRGDFASRKTGSMVADRTGKAIPYALFHLEPRGELFVPPGVSVYEGMIIGNYSKEGDLDVNPCKEKKLSNVRASGKDDHIMLTPVRPMTLEKALQYINEDELVEVTPENIRLRKAILQAGERYRNRKRK